MNNLLAGLCLKFMLLLVVLGVCSLPSPAHSNEPVANQVEQEKMLLNKLVTALKNSPRSFVYLRSKGFTQSDKEFEEIIAKNNAVFQRTLIVRRDEQGVRQIPGWPGVELTKEYKEKSGQIKQ